MKSLLTIFALFLGLLAFTARADAQCFIRIGTGSLDESYHALSSTSFGFRQGFKSGNTNLYEDFGNMIWGTMMGDPRAMIQAFGLINPKSYVKWGAAGLASDELFGITIPRPVDVYDAMVGYSPNTPNHIAMNDKISGVVFYSITAGACDDAQLFFYADTDFTGDVYQLNYSDVGKDGSFDITDARVKDNISGFSVSFSSLQVREIWQHNRHHQGFVDIAVTDSDRFALQNDGKVYSYHSGHVLRPFSDARGSGPIYAPLTGQLVAPEFPSASIDAYNTNGDIREVYTASPRDQHKMYQNERLLPDHLGRHVDVGADGQLYIVGWDGKVYLPGGGIEMAKKIAGGPNGEIYIIDTNDEVRQIRGGSNYVQGITALDLDIRDDGVVFIVSTASNVYKYQPWDGHLSIAHPGPASMVAVRGDEVLVGDGYNIMICEDLDYPTVRDPMTPLNRDPAHLTKKTVSWTQVGGRALDIGVSPIDGSVWHVDTNNQVYRYTGSKWAYMGLDDADRIAAGENGEAWVVMTDQTIRHYDSQKWVEVIGSAKDISVGKDGTVMHTNDGAVWKYDGNGGWSKVGLGGADRIATHWDGWASRIEFHQTQLGRLYGHGTMRSIAKLWDPWDSRWNNVPWDLPFWPRFRDVAYGGDGVLWGIGLDGRIFREPGKFYHITYPNRPFEVYNGLAAEISVDHNGIAWTAQENGMIWRSGQYNGPTYPDTPPPAPSVDFETNWVETGGVAADIAAGTDGSVWHIGNNDRAVYRYNGSGWDQIGTGPAARLDVAPDGDAWVVMENGSIQHYDMATDQWASVPTGGAIDIACGPDGSVWIVGTGPMYSVWSSPASNPGNWQRENIDGSRIDISANGVARVVQFDEQHFGSDHGRLLTGSAGGTFQPVGDVRLRDIGIGGTSAWGIAWGIGLDGETYQWIGDGWQVTNGGSSLNISVDSNGDAWKTTNDGVIWKGTPN